MAAAVSQVNNPVFGTLSSGCALAWVQGCGEWASACLRLSAHSSEGAGSREYFNHIYLLTLN